MVALPVTVRVALARCFSLRCMVTCHFTTLTCSNLTHCRKWVLSSSTLLTQPIILQPVSFTSKLVANESQTPPTNSHVPAEAHLTKLEQSRAPSASNLQQPQLVTPSLLNCLSLRFRPTIAATLPYHLTNLIHFAHLFSSMIYLKSLTTNPSEHASRQAHPADPIQPNILW